MLSSRISRISNVTAPLIHQAIPPTAAAFNALPPLDIASAAKRLNGVATRTPLQFSRGLSKRYNAQIYLKREDLQVVRSYKLRGAYNKISSLPTEQLSKGVVCASAGNHAQGFAYSCNKLGIKGYVFMPTITPKQKVRQTKFWGESNIEVVLTGDTFDDAAAEARRFCDDKKLTFIHPFDDIQIMEGQGTVGLEILEDLPNPDFVFLPVGGGGLASGVGTYIRLKSPLTTLIGLEPEGAPSMVAAFRQSKPVRIEKIDPFVDGAAVKRVGDLTYRYCAQTLNGMHLVPEGKVCTTCLELYNEGIVVEPAGALAIAALDDFSKDIEGKNVVCVVSGSNNDVDRMAEIKERSLQYEGLKHYFLIRFAQRPGSLKEFVTNVLGPDDDIVRFEYLQKTNKETGPALVGIEVTHRNDYDVLLRNMKRYQIDFSEVFRDDKLYGFLI